MEQGKDRKKGEMGGDKQERGRREGRRERGKG